MDGMGWDRYIVVPHARFRGVHYTVIFYMRDAKRMDPGIGDWKGLERKEKE